MINKIVMRIKSTTKRYWSMLHYHERCTFNSAQFWEARYKNGDNSGVGSYSDLAVFKADVINQFVKDHNICSIIDFGCGDGNQLTLASYPKYLGFDVSETAVNKCKFLFSSDISKQFKLMHEYLNEQADLVLSLDVIYHLVENQVFHDYMTLLFASATNFVIIYSSNLDLSYESTSHVRHRVFTDWIQNHQPTWKLLENIPQKYPEKSSADFYIYQRV